MIWKLTQSSNVEADAYDAAVVVAPGVEVARRMHPNGSSTWDGVEGAWAYTCGTRYVDRTWVAPDRVSVELLGIVHGDVGARVVLACYRTG